MTIYFVETAVSEQRVLLCRWTERFYMKKKRVQVLVDSRAEAQQVDQLLWSFSQSSFIPHAVANPGEVPPAEPVLITVAKSRIEGFEALICDIPVGVEFMSEFDFAVHFILRDDPERTAQSRVLWQKARESGMTPVHVPYGKEG